MKVLELQVLYNFYHNILPDFKLSNHKPDSGFSGILSYKLNKIKHSLSIAFTPVSKTITDIALELGAYIGENGEILLDQMSDDKRVIFDIKYNDLLSQDCEYDPIKVLTLEDLNSFTNLDEILIEFFTPFINE